jgi:hypothetical protein
MITTTGGRAISEPLVEEAGVTPEFLWPFDDMGVKDGVP